MARRTSRTLAREEEACKVECEDLRAQLGVFLEFLHEVLHLHLMAFHVQVATSQHTRLALLQGYEIERQRGSTRMEESVLSRRASSNSA